MNIIDYANISNRDVKRAFETLTDNNFHNDTSILNCYLALFFEKFGRRYGLLKEFKENCIC